MRATAECELKLVTEGCGRGGVVEGSCLDALEADAPDGCAKPPAPAAVEGCGAFLSRSVLMPEAPSAGLEDAEESAGIAAGM